MPSARWLHTKIVCTLGPATDGGDVLAGLLAAGMDVARVNLSHGSLHEHAQRIRAVREAARGLDRPIGILADLPGPKWRLGALAAGSRELRDGEPVRLAAHAGEAHELPVPHPALLAALHPGAGIYLADGAVRLAVREARAGRVDCEVLAGGMVHSRSGINAPDLDLPALVPTEEDLRCLEFAAAQGVDWIGVSFVQDAADLERVRASLPRREAPLLMAKIEKRRAVAQLDAILDAADAVMVARGDLGVETELAEVPLLQKRIIAAANVRARPVVTATQMLESMVAHERPTRAEVSDVANAVLDGTDAVMLSAESAVGRYPVLAARMLRRIVAAVEGTSRLPPAPAPSAEMQPGEALSFAACELAAKLHARAIVVRARELRHVAALTRFRPEAPIVALSPSARMANALALVAGVVSPTGMAGVRDWLYANSLAESGDLAVLVTRRATADSVGALRAIRLR